MAVVGIKLWKGRKYICINSGIMGCNIYAMVETKY